MSLPEFEPQAKDGVLDLAGGVRIGLGLERGEERVDALGFGHLNRGGRGRTAGADRRSRFLCPGARDGEDKKRGCHKGGNADHRRKIPPKTSPGQKQTRVIAPVSPGGP